MGKWKVWLLIALGILGRLVAWALLGATSRGAWNASRLTNRWSQPLAALKSASDFMKQFLMFATLAAASGGSAPSR